ncbi:MAG: hypothetical protein ACI9W2_001958 [Gammaproteobacteria bacterium]|jgi:hypothetical protein
MMRSRACTSTHLRFPEDELVPAREIDNILKYMSNSVSKTSEVW